MAPSSAGRDAEQRLAQLGAAGAHQPGQPDDLAGVQREPDAGQVDPQPLFARGQALALVDARDLATDHVMHDVVGGHVGVRAGEDGVAIAKDRDAVGDLAQLVEAMRDVDDADAAFTQAADNAEDLGSLGVRQRRGRLVEDQQARGAAERAANLHELFLRRAQPIDARLGIEREAMLGDQLARLALHRTLVEQRPSLPFAPEEEILGDREVRRQQRFLVHHRDADGMGVRRTVEIHRLPAPTHHAAIALQHARDDLHQRRLTRAVLADEGVHLTRLNVQVAALQRRHAAEVLFDGTQFEEHVEENGRRAMVPPLRQGCTVSHARRRCYRQPRESSLAFGARLLRRHVATL